MFKIPNQPFLKHFRTLWNGTPSVPHRVIWNLNNGIGPFGTFTMSATDVEPDVVKGLVNLQKHF